MVRRWSLGRPGPSPTSPVPGLAPTLAPAPVWLRSLEEVTATSLIKLPAIISCILERPFPEQSERLLQAWAYRPIRAEPLHQLAKLHRMRDEPRQAYLYAKHAAELPIPSQDILFISEDVYNWMCVDEIGATAFYCHDFERGAAACKYILDNKFGSDGDRERIQKNLETYMRVLSDRLMHQQQAQQTEKDKQKEEKRIQKRERKMMGREKVGTKTPSAKSKYKKRTKK